MIGKEVIRNKLYDEFIKPTNQKKDFIGIEIEIPIVNLNKEAVDFSIVHEVTDKFKKHYSNFKDDGIDYEGHVFSLKNPDTDDIVCYDCSYNNIEFAMGKEKDLFTINDRFCEYYSFVKESFEEFNHTLTGMGINPYRKYNLNKPIPSERYLISINSQLSMYTWWCQAQGMVEDNQNHFEMITNDILLSCLNKSVLRSQFVTEGELQQLLGDPRIYNISDAFMIAAFFEGICGLEYKELLNLYPTDIVGNKVHLCTGRELQVSKKFVDLAMQSANTYKLYLGGMGDKEKHYDMDDKRCWKRYRATAIPEREKYIVIKRLKKLQVILNSNAISSKALMESGRLNMIKKFMKAEGVDIDTAIRNHKNEIEYRYGSFQNITTYCKKFNEIINSP